jgi:hypothetical protein
LGRTFESKKAEAPAAAPPEPPHTQEKDEPVATQKPAPVEPQTTSSVEAMAWDTNFTPELESSGL